MNESETICADVISSIYGRIRNSPDDIAISSRKRKITYRELGCGALGISTQLRASRFGVGTTAAVLLPPGPDFVTATLGIMASGGAYLPLEPTYPPERLRLMIEDSGAEVLLTRRELLSGALQILNSLPIIDVDRCDARNFSDAEPVKVSSGQLAYLIYTSGSTGQPKGVEVTHRGLANLVQWHNSTFSVRPKDRASQIASLSFDAAVWEIWPYLSAGACVCFPESAVRDDPERLKAWLVGERITITFVPTPLAERVVTTCWPRETALRIMLTGGDRLRRHPREDLPFDLINNYGPTEYTVVATSGKVSATDDLDSPPSIGKPISNTIVHILDADLRPVPRGTPGEICISGPGLARGYRNAPELSRERFVADPFSPEPGARLYRTGDRARIGDDGEIEFLGRFDDQIKIRGFRVEPDEVSIALSRHPKILETVIVARRGAAMQGQLVAYVVSGNNVSVSDEELRSFLRLSLPEHMIPSVFVVLEAIPVTGSGKIDRAALPNPTRENTLGMNAFAKPDGAVEQRIAEIIKELLGVKDVGANDNFFLLGGHSLLAAQLIARLADEFDFQLPLRKLFESPTIESLSKQVVQFAEAPHGWK